MSDIVERLNAWRETPFEGDPMVDALLVDVPEAADEIQSLRQRVERLEGALREADDLIEDLIARMDYVGTGNGKSARIEEKQDRDALAMIRAALSPKVQEGDG